MERALENAPAIAFCHGDLLLRNVLWQRDDVTLLDWECGGPYPLDWDRGLLWATVTDEDRHLVEERVRRADPTGRRWAGFLAAGLFALARELQYCRPHRNPPGPTEARVRMSLAATRPRLQEALEVAARCPST